MRNFEDEPWVANNHPLSMEEEDVFANPTENEEIHDAEVTSLFEEARDKLVRVEANAIKQKRQIVVELAKSLEGKISTDSICMEIINQLRGQVSASFIRQCLDEKYKQKIRVDNARKQQQKQKIQEDEKLATLPSLNQENGENKKEIILVDGVGCQKLVQEDDKDADDDEMNSMSNESPITNDEHNGANSPMTQLHEQQRNPKTQEGHFESETAYPISKDQHFDNFELENTSEDSDQKIETNNTISTALIHHDKPNNDNANIVFFEFSLPFWKVSEYMRALFRTVGNNGDVWFNDSIDKSTGRILSSNIGRMDKATI